MSERNMLVLLIQDGMDGVESIRNAVTSSGDGTLRLQCIKSLPTALARIAGGGVAAVVLDVSARTGGSQDALEAVRQIRRAAPQAPLLVLCGAADEALAVRALRAGATDHVIREHMAARLGPALQAALSIDAAPVRHPERRRPERVAPVAGAARRGTVVAFMGAKGGVGTTTVALNVAYVLAQGGRVILAEMRPEFGTLAPYLAPHGLARNVTHALQGAPLSGCLWSSKTMPGLSVLFGPQTAAECGPLAPDAARALVGELALLADYVVLDLPFSVSAANRALVESSDSVELVVDRDSLCVQAARWLGQEIESWSGAPQPVEIVLVNRAALVSPMSLGDIDAQLGRAPLAVVPPAADLCATAANLHLALVALQPESLIAGSLVALSGSLETLVLAAARLVFRQEPLHA